MNVDKKISIVIGSGFGGIAASLRLRAKKHKVILNYYLSPILAFTFYFCFLHSIKHSFSLIFQLNSESFKSGFFIFLKKALPLTILTSVIYLITLFNLNNSYEFNDSILKVIFIGLASLTFPHILLGYLLEKNES